MPHIAIQRLRAPEARAARSLSICLVAVGLLLVHPPSDLAAQFAEPCQVTCGAILGGTGFVAATGAAVAVGRMSGGMTSVNQGLWIWGSSFVAVVGGGVLLSGNGERQRRAIYAAGIGTLVGAISGLTIEALHAGDAPRILAGTLMGAAAGAIIGGVYGALSHDGDSPQGAVPLFSVGIPF